MGLGRYLVDAVLQEGRSPAELAAAHGVSRSWVYELLARHRADPEHGLEPGSRRPHASPTQVPVEVEERIVTLRKELTEEGLDAGAHTIHYHLSRRGGPVPSISTIWRILKRRGFVTPQPQKRPRSSLLRFQADLPNECWQADTTHWALADRTDVEILNIIDDHSRLLVASVAHRVTKAADVVACFHQAATRWGYPASMLTDNGAIFTAASRNGRCALETELDTLGIAFKHSRPYHPQTCGKIERLHQTLKRFLAKQPPARTITELQALLDRFSGLYNTARPHRSLGRRTPTQVQAARLHAGPSRAGFTIPAHYRVRHDKIDGCGVVTLRHRSRLHHIGIGRAHKNTRILILVADLDVRIITQDGDLLRHLTLDPSRDYQPIGNRDRP